MLGAKAPDDQFKDFKNHVLHVRDNFWGGAESAAKEWYATLLDRLRTSDWTQAAFAAGVLSHYVTDPLMPLHTAQSEAEGAVHRAMEWSVTKSYMELRKLIHELGGYPEVNVPTGPGWLSQVLREGASFSNPYYELLIDHYNLEAGVKHPPSGLDQTSRQAIAHCLAQATVRWARVFDHAVTEAAVEPPAVSLTLPGVVAAIKVPIRVITSALADQRDRLAVESIYHELTVTGRVVDSLPADDNAIRQLHAAEVLKVPLAQLNAEKPRPAGQKFGQEVPVAATPLPKASMQSSIATSTCWPSPVRLRWASAASAPIAACRAATSSATNVGSRSGGSPGRPLSDISPDAAWMAGS